MDTCLRLQPPPEGISATTWAKFHYPTKDSMTLYRHLDDTACVASHMWENWLSKSARKLIAQECKGNDTLAKKIAVLIAAGHDIGKHSSAFAMQVVSLKLDMIDAGAKFLRLTPDERHAAPHGIVSALSFMDWFDDRIDAGYAGCFEAIASIVASHHGRFPNENIFNNNPTYERERNSHWHSERLAWWDRAVDTACLNREELEQLCEIELSQPAQLILSGFLVMCDWIASNQELFPLIDAATSEDRTARALDALQLPAAWEPLPPSDDAILFSSRFRLPGGVEPRPVQQTAMRMARETSSPCLMLIEAPTGEGKTEAALGAAEILVEKLGLNGVVFALPTCATSDGIFPRVTDWLATTLPDDTEVSAILTHGRANFNEQYRELFSPQRIANIHDEESNSNAIRAHWWLRGRKTSALASCCVGTIDQVLFAALSSRHLMLRHLGLSGKVVIFDEIHASDTYMMVYLTRVLYWLGAMGVPVIALSATLNPERRSELLIAYKKGICRRSGVSYRRKARKADESAAQNTTGYPLISIATDAPLAFETLQPSGRTSEYHIEFIPGDTTEIAQFIQDMYADGGCVGIICNTVRRAQEIYAQLEQNIDHDELILLHSRFVAAERRRIERDLTSKLGPNTKARPKKLIVVATQVIEQSLDIDFDFLYTDLAPIDLIIQRAGRLHRHIQNANNRPARFSHARLAIGGVDNADQTAPVIDKGSVAVYGAALLLRTLTTLLDHEKDGQLAIHSPDDVAPLVRKTYSKELTPPAHWQELWDEATELREASEAELRAKARTFCINEPTSKSLIGFDDSTAGEADENNRGSAQVRDGEDSLDVILVQRVNDEIRTLPFLEQHPGIRVDLTAGIDEDVARTVSMCTVSLPSFMLRGPKGEQIIQQLEDDGFIDSWQQSRWLKGELPLILDAEFTAELAGFHLEYNMALGLQVTTPKRKL